MDAGDLPMGEPLAYFLTWPTYGTWLPGDERGWVRYRHGWQMPDPALVLEAQAKMTEDTCILDIGERVLVEKTIAEHCRIRDWKLHAVNCRSNHVHAVVTADRTPEEVRDQLKAWCTRKLKDGQRERQRGPLRKKWWAERGSQRYVNDEVSLEAAIRYVLDGQEGDRE